ncbi:MAG: hypothetical protein RJB62_1588 [Pseudomonadota bacterium]|jgi:GNAT superfamily N-acetyltransferase
MTTLPDISLIENPGAELREAILRPLAAFNAACTGPASPESFALILRHPGSGETIGGLWGVMVYDWLNIELIFVPEDLRRQGLGASLLKHAEAFAAKHGCNGVRLDTFSFQAPAFYEKHGYRSFGRLENIPKGHDRIYYFKMLVNDASAL